MIVEIFYKGEVIKTVDLPEVTSLRGLEFGMRIMSKGEAPVVIAPELDKRLQFHGNKGKKFVKDKPLVEFEHRPVKKKSIYEPRVKIPQKEVAVFERAKAEYSNTRNYDL